jgi:hypothetical protein
MNPMYKLAFGGALAAATITGGAIGASFLGTAGAATSSSTSTSAPATATRPQAPFPAHGTAAHEDQEKPVTGDAAAKAQAAAVKSVGGGTAGAVTTDFTGNGYEVTVTKSDGTQVEVHLDSSFNVMQGRGNPGPGGPDSNDAANQPAAATSTA